MSRTRFKAGALLTGFAIMSLCGAAPAAASDIEVIFELDLPAMTDLWPPGKEKKVELEVEGKIRSALRDMVREHFRYWKFSTPASPAPAGRTRTPDPKKPETPRMIFRLHEELANEALVTLEIQVDGHQPPLLKEVLWGPRQFHQAAVYSPKKAENEIPGFFFKKLIEPNFQVIRRQLMNSVPLAEGTWRTPSERAPQPAIILPLPWDDVNQDLRESEFRLDCERQKTFTRLFAVGTGQSDSYPFPSGQKQKVQEQQALVATPYKREYGGRIEEIRSAADLEDHKLRYVFLQEYRPPSPLKIGRPQESKP